MKMKILSLMEISFLAEIVAAVVSVVVSTVAMSFSKKVRWTVRSTFKHPSKSTEFTISAKKKGSGK